MDPKQTNDECQPTQLPTGVDVTDSVPKEPKGYVVFDLEITDPEKYEEYRLLGQASVRKYRGRVLSGDPPPRGVVEQLEGDWPTRRLVINEFDSVETARAWWNSPEYRAASLERRKSSSGRILLVSGWNRPW